MNCFQILFSVSIGGMSLGNASPAIASFSSARAAAYAMWQIIDRVSSNPFPY